MKAYELAGLRAACEWAVKGNHPLDFTPATVLKLLDEIDRLKEALEPWACTTCGIAIEAPDACAESRGNGPCDKA